MENLPESYLAGKKRDFKAELAELKQQALGGEEFWAAFSSLSQEFIEQVRAEQRARELERTAPLPEYLYHATTPQNAEKILSLGLKPGYSKNEVDKTTISLSDGVGLGLLAAAVTQGVQQEDLVVLRVRTVGLPRGEFWSLLPFQNPFRPGAHLEEVRFDGEVIPPENITVVSSAEVQSLLAAESSQAKELAAGKV